MTSTSTRCLLETSDFVSEGQEESVSLSMANEAQSMRRRDSNTTTRGGKIDAEFSLILYIKIQIFKNGIFYRISYIQFFAVCFHYIILFSNLPPACQIPRCLPCHIRRLRIVYYHRIFDVRFACFSPAFCLLSEKKKEKRKKKKINQNKKYRFLPAAALTIFRRHDFLHVSIPRFFIYNSFFFRPASSSLTLALVTSIYIFDRRKRRLIRVSSPLK